jgi:hypothetical protein
MDTDKIGDSALVAGLSTIVRVLYRNTASGIDAATGGVTTVVYVIPLPVAGVLAGVYAYADAPYSVVPLFLLGSYLGVFGLGLMLGSVPGSTPIGLSLALGVVLLVLSPVAPVTSVSRTTASVPLDFLRSPSR